MHSNGVTDICEQFFYPQPPTPVVRLLGLYQPAEGNTNILRFEVENTSIDSKTGHLILAAYHGSRHSIIVTEDGRYSYPTWYWSIVYNENSPNPVIECHLTKLMPIGWDYYAEFKSADRYRDKKSGTYTLKFVLGSDLKLLNVEVVQEQ
ncbi:MAG: hypothetical protein U5R06_15685 [candidate division KSB1 bacterium]|nr:hypothetical protein [candidate division KSB1 bacterium]